MTFLLEWDFSIVAEPCPQNPSLLWEKELYLCLTPWDLWIDLLKPIKCKTEAAHWKSSWPHLPLCALLSHRLCLGWGSLAVPRCDAHRSPREKPPVPHASGVLKGSQGRTHPTRVRLATLAEGETGQARPPLSPSAWCCDTITTSHWAQHRATASGTQLTESLVLSL